MDISLILVDPVPVICNNGKNRRQITDNNVFYVVVNREQHHGNFPSEIKRKLFTF